MPRKPREKSNTGIYHIILRGINRQTIFEDDEDAVKFQQIMNTYKKKDEYKLYAYCLMGNHIHLLIKEENEELGTIMRRIGASYVYWYNFKYDRIGHLFQDRFRSEIVEDNRYFLTVLRYIHQNPLKAGLVKNVEDYKWSSYSDIIGKSKITDTNYVLSLFGNDRKKAIDSFKVFHEIENKDVCLDIDDIKRRTDDDAIEIIKKICDIKHCIEIQTLEIGIRDHYLKALKEEGLSTRQLSRLTGVSRGIILKA